MSALVILAAGVGSRYGKAKQLDALTEYGNQMIDFTIYDAIQAGFERLYLIIQKQHEELFEQQLVKNIRDKIEVHYVYQTMPEKFAERGRQKPLGTGYALYCCKGQVNEPFVLCNADDYYGRDAFMQMQQFIKTRQNHDMAMMGYILKNTLSEHGSVSRGVCTIENGYLKQVEEVLKIDKNTTIPLDSIVSMNFWLFDKTIFEHLTAFVDNFLKSDIETDFLKKECLLPTGIEQLITEGKISVKVMTSNEKWMGMTYPEDKPLVVQGLQQAINKGVYPQQLW